MDKYLKSTTIELPKSNHAKCPIYKHDNKFYIKTNKPNTKSYNSIYFNNEEYAEIELIAGHWFMV